MGIPTNLLLFLSSTHYCSLFHPFLSEIYPLLTTLRPSKGGLKRQSLLQTWCGSAPRRGQSANGYDAWRLDPADPGARSLQLLLQTWCWSAPRRGPSANGCCCCCCFLHINRRRLAFWILRTRAQDPRSCCCRPGVGLRPAVDHPQMVTMPGVLDPADPCARSLQLLLQTWCGSAPRRGPSSNGYDAWCFGSCGPTRKILAAAA